MINNVYIYIMYILYIYIYILMIIMIIASVASPGLDPTRSFFASWIGSTDCTVSRRLF